MELSNKKLKVLELQKEEFKKETFEEFKKDLDEEYLDLFSDGHYDIFVNLMELLNIDKIEEPLQYLEFVAFLDKYSSHRHNYIEEEIKKYLDEEENSNQDDELNNDVVNYELYHIEKKRYGELL
jgi:hypothetical protein